MKNIGLILIIAAVMAISLSLLIDSWVHGGQCPVPDGRGAAHILAHILLYFGMTVMGYLAWRALNLIGKD